MVGVDVVAWPFGTARAPRAVHCEDEVGGEACSRSELQKVDLVVKFAGGLAVGGALGVFAGALLMIYYHKIGV